MENVEQKIADAANAPKGEPQAILGSLCVLANSVNWYRPVMSHIYKDYTGTLAMKSTC